MKDLLKLCRIQSGEYMRLSNLAPREVEARRLKDISASWTRLAGQLDRYLLAYQVPSRG
jgi:hypothetical protein